jgi:4'-phosphopantetheinyl transferase
MFPMSLEFAKTTPQSRVGQVLQSTLLESPSDDAVKDWRLETGQCHVWSASLTADAAEFRRMLNTLSPREHQRAEGFHFEKDRNAYIQCRGILRRLLARYLQVGPDELCFSTSGHGKPYLTGPSNHFDLRFNLSHSNGRALFAFTRSHEVGVDIEYLQRLIDWKPVAELMFSPRENAELAALSPENRLPGFFHGWTRKEAVLKATGEGIALGMNQIEVSLTPTMPCRLLVFRGEAARCSEWSLRHLDPAPDFVGAVAVERPNMEFRRGTWRPDTY